MNKNKSRRNRMTYKKRSYKKINRTRKGGMPSKRPFLPTGNNKRQKVNESLNSSTSSGSRPPFSVSTNSTNRTPPRATSSINYSSPPTIQTIITNNNNPPEGPSRRMQNDLTFDNDDGLDVNTQVVKLPSRRSNRDAALKKQNVHVFQYPKEEIPITKKSDPRDQEVTQYVVGSNVKNTQLPEQTVFQNIQQNIQQKIKENIIRPFLSWFGFLEDDIQSTIVSTPPQNTTTTPQKSTRVESCESPQGVNDVKCDSTPIGQKVTFKGTPDTTGVIVGTSLVDFSTIIVNYLNKRIPQIPSNIRTSLKTPITEDNYYDSFLRYLQEVKKFRIYDNNRKNKLNDYFKTSNLDPDAENNITKFDRTKFIDFVNSILPGTLTFEPKKLRIDYSGKTLAHITESQSQTIGEEYISNFKDNTNEGVQCNDEKEWVFKCINSRNNNYISKKECGEWKLLINDTRDTNKKRKLINDLEEGNLFKQKCGTCWICGKEIYHYYVVESNSIDRTYLNTKCGEDEHIFPPTVGDIIGTLNMDAGLTKQTIDTYGKNTLLTYGIRPSHAFCNQMKSDFLLYGLLLTRDGDVNSNQLVNEKYIKDKWKDIVQKWFGKERYNSLENIQQIFKNISTTNNVNIDIVGPTIQNTSNNPDPAINYFDRTLENIKQYLNKNIAPMILQQAAQGKSNVGNMLKLKILIYIIQIGKNIIGKPFLEIWNKNMTTK